MKAESLYKKIYENYLAADSLMDDFLHEWFEGLDYKKGTVYERKSGNYLSLIGNVFVVNGMSTTTGLSISKYPSCRVNITPLTKSSRCDERFTNYANYFLIRPDEKDLVKANFDKVEGRWIKGKFVREPSRFKRKKAA